MAVSKEGFKMTLTNLPKNKKAVLLKRPENEITDEIFDIIDGIALSLRRMNSLLELIQLLLMLGLEPHLMKAVITKPQRYSKV